MPDKSAVPEKKIILPVITPQRLAEISEFVLREGAAGEVRGVLNIGRYLFSQLFRSSEEAFRSKDPTKPDSLRDLAALPRMVEAKWGRTRLDNSIELFLMARAHNDFRAWRFLRVSHYVKVIGMPADQQRDLLDRAEKEGWSVKVLTEEVAKLKPARPQMQKAGADHALGPVRELASKADALAKAGAALAPRLVETGIDAKDAEEFSAMVEKVRSMAERFRKQLEGMKKKSAARLQRVAGKVAGHG